MKRREFTQGLVALLTFGSFSDSAQSQAPDRKAIEDMQKNWKSLLAEGTPEVTAAPPLPLPALLPAVLSVPPPPPPPQAASTALNNKLL